MGHRQAGGVLRRARARRRRPDHHRRLRAQQARLAQAVRLRDDQPAPRRAAPAGHRRGARRGRRDRAAGAARRPLRLPPALAERVGQEVADHAVQAERDVDQGGRPHRDRLRARASRWREGGLRRASRSWAPRATSSTSSSPRAPTTATTSGAARPRAGCASPSRSYAARASWSATTSRSSTGSRCSTSSRAARPGTRPSSSRCTLEAAGVTVFNTGIGWHEARVPTIITQVPRGAWRSYTARLKQVVDVPVCASNRINTPELAEEILAAGEADLVSMARPLLADPAFVAKAMDERADEINTCIACNQACLDHVFANQRASCLVNPRACHETELVLMPTLRKQTVAVVGAGPAGLAAAVSAAERGFAVTLFEKSRRARRPVPPRDGRSPARRTSPTRCATSPAASRSSASTYASAPRPPPTTSPASTRSSSPPASSPGCRPSRASTTRSVASYAEVLERRGRAGQAGRGDRRRRHRRRRQRLPHPRPRRTSTTGWRTGASATRRCTAGGLTEAKPRTPAREVTLVQRKTTPIGIGLGKTSGWAHRAVLKQSGVTQVSGATYDRIDDDGPAHHRRRRRRA